MPVINNLSIAILTYRRPKELKLCLESISIQKYQPQKIIIIDSFKKHTSIPESRNLALKQCQTKFLAFIDDDCVLDKNWVYRANQAIKNNPSATYIVGKTILQNPQNPIARAQFKNYQDWFNLYHPLDTKNVIFNFPKIKHIKFDPQFKIFEDVDFNQQLEKLGLHGTYCSKMIVHHPETSSLIKTIKKNFLRGQYKAKITNKWGNFDDFQPSPPSLNQPLNFIIKTAFNLGYLKNPPRPITIVNHQDQGANGQRLQAFYNFLKTHHLYVLTINSESEFNKVIASKKYFFIYGYPLIKYKILKFFHDRLKINQSSKIFLQTLYLKGNILHRLLTKNKSSFAIIQYPEDMLTVIKKRQYQTLYDSPTIYFRESELSHTYSPQAISTLKQLESQVYQKSNFVSFHWYSYFDLAKKYHLTIKHPLHLNWGCQIPSKTATLKSLPKTIYLGKLNSYWVNPKLLSSISQNNHLDIFSYEKPDEKIYPHLHHFKGYLKDEKQLTNYQFGLITISPDDLRTNGFSAKYLLYLSFGLPVLCPEWRQDKLLKSATIYYNDKNLQKQIKKYSQKHLWLKKHQSALSISKKLDWNINLLPLLKIIPKK